MRNLFLFAGLVVVTMSFLGGKAAENAKEVREMQETRMERIERSLGR